MKISVIVPIYNVEEYLEECLDSVVAQTFSDWEMILVDDGSTDGSGEIAEKYAQKYDNIFVIHQANEGLSAARNTGLNVAKGEYVYFLDSDDYILDSTLQIVYETAKKNCAELVIFNGINFEYDHNSPKNVIYTNKLVDEFKSWNNVLDGKQIFAKMIEESSLLLCCVPLQFVRRDIIIKNNLSFKQGILHEDNLYSFWLLMSINSGIIIDDVLYMRRLRGDSITNTRISVNNVRSWCIIFDEIINWCNNGKADEKTKEYIYKYLRFFFMDIVQYYCYLKRKDRKELKIQYRSVLEKAKQNKYLNSRDVKIICKFRGLYSLYKKILSGGNNA